MSVRENHRLVATQARVVGSTQGYVAWCSCGMGSPLKPSPVEAKTWMDAHLANPQVIPS